MKVYAHTNVTSRGTRLTARLHRRVLVQWKVQLLQLAEKTGSKTHVMTGNETA